MKFTTIKKIYTITLLSSLSACNSGSNLQNSSQSFDPSSLTSRGDIFPIIDFEEDSHTLISKNYDNRTFKDTYISGDLPYVDYKDFFGNLKAVSFNNTKFSNVNFLAKCKYLTTFTNTVFEKSLIKNALFYKCRVDGSQFNSSTIMDTKFEEMNLASFNNNRAQINNSKLQNLEFSNSELLIFLDNSTLNQVHFNNNKLSLYVKNSMLTSSKFNKGLSTNLDIEKSQLFDVLFQNINTGVLVLKDTSCSQCTIKSSKVEEDFRGATKFSNSLINNVTFMRSQPSYMTTGNVMFSLSEISDLTAISLNWRGFQVEKSNMKNINFENTIFTNCSFIDSNLKNVNFKKTRMENCTFQNLEFDSDISFQQSKLYGFKFNRVIARNVNFQSATFENGGYDFANSDLRSANFNGSNIDSVYSRVGFEHTDLRGAIWSNGQVCNSKSIGNCFFDGE